MVRGSAWARYLHRIYCSKPDFKHDLSISHLSSSLPQTTLPTQFAAPIVLSSKLATLSPSPNSTAARS